MPKNIAHTLSILLSIIFFLNIYKTPIFATGNLVKIIAANPQSQATNEAELAKIERFILSIDTFAVTESKQEVGGVQVGHGRPNYNNGSRLYCEVQEHKVTENLEEYLVLDANSSNIWPGAIIQGKTLDQPLLSGINLARSSGRITVDGLSLSKSSSTLQEPSLSNLQEALEEILPIEPVVPTAKLSFFSAKVHSLEQALLETGISFNHLSSSFKAGLSIERAEENHHKIVKFVQPYYTVSFEDPTSPTSFFGDATLDDALLYMGTNNPPSYISSVTYGRMFIALFSSKHDPRDLDIAINIVTSLFSKEGDVEAGLDELLKDVRVQLIAVGGSAEDAMKIITAKDFIGYLEGGNVVSRFS